jgi:acetyl-CoA C-acetyltransferase
VQTLSVMKVLGMTEEKVNLRGEAVAIGHRAGPAARIATTLLGCA